METCHRPVETMTGVQRIRRSQGGQVAQGRGAGERPTAFGVRRGEEQ